MINKQEIDYTLYLCTDRDIMSTPTVEEAVRQAVQGGCGIVQLREKHCSTREFLQIAKNVKAVTQQYHVPLIINDRVDIALAVDADGVHVGQKDMPCTLVRQLLGPDKIVGVSAHNREEALLAVEEGADYLGVGAIHSTGTKTDAGVISREEFAEVRAAVGIPIVGIGGVNKNTLDYVRSLGADGMAVVSAVIGAPDIFMAAKELVDLWKK